MSTTTTHPTKLNATHTSPPNIVNTPSPVPNTTSPAPKPPPQADAPSTNTPATHAPQNSDEADPNHGVHPSAVGSATKPDTISSRGPDAQSEGGDSHAPDGGYPEQKHAGKVGYGPQYHQGAGLLEKMTGLKEQVKGKATKNPELIQRGKERKTGELKHKEMEDDDDPFATPDEKKKSPLTEPERKPSTTASQHSSHQAEQAATVAPEGTNAAETQRKGEAVENVKSIGT